jgi:zinc transport system substrate-binding protein
MKRWLSLVLVCLFVAGIALAGCSIASTGKTADTTAKIKVVASFYPMYEFAKQVGKEKVDVKVLVPAGVEPHDWEPSPQDVAAIQTAKVFVYNGAGFEHWVAKTLKNVQNPALIPVETSQGIELLQATDENEHGHGTEAQGHVPSEEEKDPHVWLDPVYAQFQVKAIRDALIKADPVNQNYYETNAEQYIAKLAALDKEFQEATAKAQHKEFITSHAAFSYMAKRYGLEQIPIMGMAPHVEPTPERLKSLIEEAKEHHIKYVFFETLVSPKVADILAKEAGANTLVLNPIEGLTQEDLTKSKDYISLMQENLTNLKLALEVK